VKPVNRVKPVKVVTPQFPLFSLTTTFYYHQYQVV
jgi:hypothetical protein